MKRYIKSSESTDGLLNIEVIFDVQIDDNSNDVAAATYKGHEIPEGELPPADKNAVVDSQVWQDYQDVIEVIEDLIEDHNLNIYYTNESDYHSFYWSALAKDSKGNSLMRFTVRIRVSTHDAHRTKESQENKKKERSALRKLTEGKRVTPMPITVVVNNESKQFQSYMDVVVYVDEKLDHALKIMTRK